MKGVSILGATGSIGRQTLEIISHHTDKLRVIALTAGHDVDAMAELANRWHPKLVALLDAKETAVLKQRVDCPVLYGLDGLTTASTHPEVDIVVVAVPTSKALIPTLNALKAGKRVALATKEVLVAGGYLVSQQIKQGGELLPVDSEHSALWQCLQGEDRNTVKRILLTASGGPFRNKPLDEIKRATVEEALIHPTWKMGPKVTIDSATMMNKGLEIIEANWMFNLPPECIEVILHPQSIIHSLVEFIDGSIKAQLSLPDMRLSIQYALLYPERHPCPATKLDLLQIDNLTFEPCDEQRFPCLRLAKEAAKVSGTMPTVLSASDEVATKAFLERRIGFMDIPAIVEEVMNRHNPTQKPDLETIWSVDEWARTTSQEIVLKKQALR